MASAVDQKVIVDHKAVVDHKPYDSSSLDKAEHHNVENVEFTDEKIDPELQQQRLHANIDEGLDPVAIKKLTRRIDWRLVPVLSAMYAISLIDRTNLAIARAANNVYMDKELGTNKGDRYSIITLIFFIPYIIFEMPVRGRETQSRLGADFSLKSVSASLVLVSGSARRSSFGASSCSLWLSRTCVISVLYGSVEADNHRAGVHLPHSVRCSVSSSLPCSPELPTLSRAGTLARRWAPVWSSSTLPLLLRVVSPSLSDTRFLFCTRRTTCRDGGGELIRQRFPGLSS